MTLWFEVCSDGVNGCEDLAAVGGFEHFVVGSKPGRAWLQVAIKSGT
ncbi:hypothetical protein [Ruegeria sp. AU67]|nr:hypothetical protein [Ruegeria sp. AU67]